MADLRSETWTALFDAMAAPTVVGDPATGRIRFANAAARALFGYSMVEFTEKTGRQLHPDGDTTIDAVSDAIDREGHAFLPRIQLNTRDFRTCWARLHVSRVAQGDDAFFVATYRDITDEVERSAQLERLAQLTTVGRLAAGVAHEVNNPATFVLANLDTLEASISDPDLKEVVDESIAGVQRIARVAQQLKGLAHDRIDADGVIDYDAALEEAASLTRTLVERRGRLLVQHGEVGLGQGDHNRLVQALVNLLLNAAEAIRPGGVVRLRARRLGQRVHVLVEDDGLGMTPQVQSRALEPFFTTRPAGKGTGLGLSVAWRIVTDLGGHVLLSSAPDHGTTVTLDLPLSQAQEQPQAPPQRTRQRILVVDDELNLLRAARRMLGKHYDVTAVSTGQDALAQAPYADLILLDLIMPNMDGREVYNQLPDDIKPRVLFISAGALDGPGRAFLKTVPFLRKPFGLPELLEALAKHADRLKVQG